MKKKSPKATLLLTNDVAKLGRKGDVVSVKPGFAKNFLLPQRHARLLDKHALRIRAALQQERFALAEKDKKEALIMKDKIQGAELTIVAKVDPDGNMYGSVAGADVHAAIVEAGYRVDKSVVALPKPIKNLGTYTVHLQFKEGVTADIQVTVEAIA